MKKLALAMIVKGSDDEAVLLDRCLSNLGQHVDGIFITSTYKKGEQPNKQVEKIAKVHGATLSTFEWVQDFSKARNFNFSQVPKEYDYIMWTDADDQWRGAEKLKEVINENSNVDAFAFWYLYDFDQYKNPTVCHKKTQVIRNDGTFSWVGELHEDLTENRSVNVKFIEGIDRMHFTTDERVQLAKERNIGVSKKQVEDNPNEPRAYFNLANSFFGANEIQNAILNYEKFIELSNSDDEIYIARMRLAECYAQNANRKNAIEQCYIAIGTFPTMPDAYLLTGQIMFDFGRWDDAEKYTLLGLRIKPAYHKMIVFNPRDYDYNPMMLLVKTYFKKSRPDLALPMLEGCMKIYPDNKELGGIRDGLKKEIDRLNSVMGIAEELSKIEDKDLLKRRINALEADIRSHPYIAKVYNENFIVTETDGNEIAYYCGYTEHIWDAKLFETKGFGGSEEAVVNLTRKWAKAGKKVTVYNNCSEEMVVDGVTYKPYYFFNTRNKFDTVILWRHPAMADHKLNAREVLVDMHDVIQTGEFTEKRLENITKIFFKTKFHRSLFPNVPEEKVVIIPNGLDTEMFDTVEKDQYLLFNSSSPDRSMDVLPKLFKKVKEQVPEAKCVWAYGWDIFDQAHSDNNKMLEWKANVVREIEDAGIVSLGKIPQKECAKWYAKANVLAYPSEFAEIDCISVKKAQYAQCIPVATTFGAFPESIIHGEMVQSDKTAQTWCKPYQMSFGLESEEAQNEWVEKVVSILKTPIKDRTKMSTDISDRFSWDVISKKWLQLCQH